MSERRPGPVQGETVLLPLPDLDVQADTTTTPDGPALVGSACSACGTRMAGRRAVCSHCTSQDLRLESLGPNGTLYSFTTIHVSPRSAEPYTLGYVDLTGGVRVLAPIDGPAESLECDLPMRLAVDGERWAFRPSD